MKNYLYYPSFEPPNTEWLKFSLLYLEKMDSIVPYSRRHLISEDYQRIIDGTDLIELYSPKYFQGQRASLKVIESAEKILDKPYRWSTIHDQVNLRRKWQDPANWNYQIYSEKFSSEFTEFCLENRIGGRNNDGLSLPRELGFMFMTHLAKEISFHTEKSIITDNREFDNYTNYHRVIKTNSVRRNKFMKGLIHLLIPANIADIGFNEIIEFRNQNRDKISILNTQIDLIEESIGNGTTESDFIDSFNDSFSEITKEILQLGIGIAQIPFTSYVLISNPLALSGEYIKEILAGIGMGFGGAFALRAAFKTSGDRRTMKKYFVNLRRLR